jgi:uncharacterized protein (UPF0333 family)
MKINTNLKKIIFDKRGQISLEFLLIMGVVIIGAIIVGYFLKQSAVKNAQKAQKYQPK